MRRAPSANVAENNIFGVRSNVSGSGVDAGVKIDVAGFEGVLYGYTGHGLGTTGLYILATDAFGNERNSSGGYAQATYKIDRLKIGLSYGVSDLKMAQGDILADNLLKRNESGVFGLYYSLTKSLTLVGEFIDSKSTAHSGNEATEKGCRGRRDPVLLADACAAVASTRRRCARARAAVAVSAAPSRRCAQRFVSGEVSGYHPEHS